MASASFQTTSGHRVSNDSCSCMFVTCMQIPCRHIFKLLKIQEEDRFVPLLFAMRWTKEYYHKSHPAVSAYEQISRQQPVSVRQIRVPDEITKYKKVSTVTKEINYLAASMSTGEYAHYGQATSLKR